MYVSHKNWIVLEHATHLVVLSSIMYISWTSFTSLFDIQYLVFTPSAYHSILMDASKTSIAEVVFMLVYLLLVGFEVNYVFQGFEYHNSDNLTAYYKNQLKSSRSKPTKADFSLLLEYSLGLSSILLISELWLRLRMICCFRQPRRVSTYRFTASRHGLLLFRIRRIKLRATTPVWTPEYARNLYRKFKNRNTLCMCDTNTELKYSTLYIFFDFLSLGKSVERALC